MMTKKEILVTSLVGVLVVAAAVTTTYMATRNDKTAEDVSTDTASVVVTPDVVSAPVAATAQDCVGDSCLSVAGLEYPVGNLPVAVANAVRSALDDEYKASTAYNTIIAKLGSVRPFSMIIRAEEGHVANLKSVLDKYGESIPENPYLGKIVAAETIKENCQIGVDAEISNIALYRDSLLPLVKDYADITIVFNSLMVASRDKHLPSFEKCN